MMNKKSGKAFKKECISVKIAGNLGLKIIKRSAHSFNADCLPYLDSNGEEEN